MTKLQYCAIGAAFLIGFATAQAAEDSVHISQDSLNSLEAKVRSTLLFGGSDPVSFSGQARLKIQEHYFPEHPSLMDKDLSWTQAGWEGNESMMRLSMMVHASRNTVLWTQLGFQNTLPGNFLNSSASESPDGFYPAQYPHDKLDLPATIDENMQAGIAIRTAPASFMLKLGGVNWTQASPFTIWKSQPRTFVWDYLPFEIEQPISTYYDYDILKGVKAGRAAWNKKAFQGINLESIHLPANLYFNFLYGTFENYDNYEREFIDFSGDVGYANLTNAAKQTGIGDSYRHMWHARLAQDKALGNLTVGLNAVGIVYDKDIALDPLFQKVFLFPQSFYDTNYHPAHTIFQGSGFYKEPQTYSLDFQGPVGDDWEVQGDVAVNFVDTTWNTFGYTVDSSGSSVQNLPYDNSEVDRTALHPAVFAQLKYNRVLPTQAEFAYVSKGFYSPFSFAIPMDAFFPFGANLVGSGKFIERSEASPYVQNETGLSLTVSPNVGNGHLIFKYGQHWQIQSARDLLFFPYRLNGQDLISFFQSSYNRWGNDLIDVSLPVSDKYMKRLGDESYHTQEYNSPEGPDAGGLRADYLSTFEGFVPYENAAQADSNSLYPSTITTPSPYVPQHQKWTNNLEMDGAYDIGPVLGYSHDFFLSAYFALNSISTSFTPLALSETNMLLWGTYFRFEPAIALSDKFYVLGLAGYENWRSDMAYMKNGPDPAQLVPIDYKDFALGIGFDWDFASRVGLHIRTKWMKHEDVYFNENNWTARLASAEIKMWF